MLSRPQPPPAALRLAFQNMIDGAAAGPRYSLAAAIRVAARTRALAGIPTRAGVRALIGILVVLAWSGPASAATPTWNPWGKESPEPYGYDVTTAADQPLGVENPEDPPARLPDPPPSDPRFAVLTVATTVDRTAYSWFGRITVTADVQAEGVPAPDCDSVVAISAANPRVRAHLADDGIAPDVAAGDSRYSGYFDIGAGEGEARPTGSYTVTATAYRGVENGFDDSASFSLFSVRRWTGISTTDLPDPSDQYTAFFVTPIGPGLGFHHEIRDFGLVRSTSVANAQIRIPVLPRENALSGLLVTGTGVSDVAVRDNVIEFTCDLTGATVRRVTIEFDAPSDLAATRIDRYQTGDIALRDFRNGYQVWNRYISTAILGSGYTSPHGPGCIVDLHATDLANGSSHTLDCMERVAVHLDNAAFNDGSGTYPSNIKWGGDALSWMEGADLSSLRFRFLSGGGYGLANKVAVDRRVEFYSESRFFRHRYLLRNIDTAGHDFDFVWGREQWLYGSAAGSDREDGDRGLLPNDAASYGGEYGFGPAQIDGNWFAAFDQSSFYSLGVILPGRTAEAMPTRAYFLCDPPLGNFTGEYPIIPAGTCADMANLFFEKQLGVLAPGDSAAYEFYMWGGYGHNRQELTDLLEQDAGTIAGGLSSVESPPSGEASAPFPDRDPERFLVAARPTPFSVSTEIAFVLPTAAPVSLTVFDASGRRVISVLERALPAGRHTISWDGSDARGRPVPGGVYFIRLDAGDRVRVARVVVHRS